MRILRKSRRGRWVRFCAVAMLPILLLVGADALLRPGVQRAVVNRGRQFAAQLTADTVAALLQESPERFEQLAVLRSGADGSVHAIEMQALAVSWLQSTIAQRLSHALAPGQQVALEVPLGTLSGVQWLSGFGPMVPLTVQLYGAPQIDLWGEFSAAAINQTVHRVQLSVTLDLVILLPFYSLPVRTNSRYMVAETIIVGETPLFVGRANEP